MTFVMIMDLFRPRCCTVVNDWQPERVAEKLREHYHGIFSHQPQPKEVVVAHTEIGGGRLLCVETRGGNAEDDDLIALICDMSDVTAIKACLAQVGDGQDEVMGILQGRH